MADELIDCCIDIMMQTLRPGDLLTTATAYYRLVRVDGPWLVVRLPYGSTTSYLPPSQVLAVNKKPITQLVGDGQWIQNSSSASHYSAAKCTRNYAATRTGYRAHMVFSTSRSAFCNAGGAADGNQ